MQHSLQSYFHYMIHLNSLNIHFVLSANLQILRYNFFRLLFLYSITNSSCSLSGDFSIYLIPIRFILSIECKACAFCHSFNIQPVFISHPKICEKIRNSIWCRCHNVPYIYRIFIGFIWIFYIPSIQIRISE